MEIVFAPSVSEATMKNMGKCIITRAEQNVINRIYLEWGVLNELKTKSHHDAKFVITCGTGGYVKMTTTGATSDDKFGIMMACGFQSWC